MQIFTQSHGPQKCFGRTATGRSSHIELIECKTGLLFAIDVDNVVTELLARLQESGTQRGVEGGILNGQVSTYLENNIKMGD